MKLGPKKILRLFLLIPKLKRMFKKPNHSKLMRWYHNNKIQDRLVKHVTNSKPWRHIDDNWLKSATDLQNLWLGFTLDGINLFGNQSSIWSTWLVLRLESFLGQFLKTCTFVLKIKLYQF